jgi:hypothetical protein
MTVCKYLSKPVNRPNAKKAIRRIQRELDTLLLRCSDQTRRNWAVRTKLATATEELLLMYVNFKEEDHPMSDTYTTLICFQHTLDDFEAAMHEAGVAYTVKPNKALKGTWLCSVAAEHEPVVFQWAKSYYQGEKA